MKEESKGRKLSSMTEQELADFIYEQGYCGSLEYWQKPAIEFTDYDEGSETRFFTYTQKQKPDVGINVITTDGLIELGDDPKIFTQKHNTRWFHLKDIVRLMKMGFYIPLLQSDQNVKESDTRDDSSSNAAKSILPSDLQKDFKEQLEEEFPIKGDAYWDEINLRRQLGANWSFSYFLPKLEKLQQTISDLKEQLTDYSNKIIDQKLEIEKLQQENKALKG